MAKVICPEAGIQLTVPSYTVQVWCPECQGYIIIDGPHRIISTGTPVPPVPIITTSTTANKK